jgi:hypothetical protein
MKKIQLRQDDIEEKGGLKSVTFTLFKDDSPLWRIRFKSLHEGIESLFDPHLAQFGKMCYEMKGTGFTCPICNSEIDELGLCNCGTGSA